MTGPSRVAASIGAWSRATRPRFCGLLQFDLGFSTVSDDEVSNIIGGRLGYTGILMFWAFAVMVPAALLVGVLAGMRDGSRERTDPCRPSPSLSTATPEYVSGVIFIVLLASSQIGVSPLLVQWGLARRRHAVLGLGAIRRWMTFTFWNFTLPW